MIFAANKVSCQRPTCADGSSPKCQPGGGDVIPPYQGGPCANATAQPVCDDGSVLEVGNTTGSSGGRPEGAGGSPNDVPNGAGGAQAESNTGSQVSSSTDTSLRVLLHDHCIEILALNSLLKYNGNRH